MYVEIKENKLLSWCKQAYSNYEYVEIEYETFDPEKYEVAEGKLVDISQTEKYQAKIAQREKELKMAELTAQIEELDKKRVRAIAEPALKDPLAGETWLDYYTQQILLLRAEISAL